MSNLLTTPKFQAFDTSGVPLSGGKLYTYLAGTSTPKTTYSDYGQTTANTNPIILDSYGQALIYGDGLFKFVLKTSADVSVWTVDNIRGISQSVDLPWVNSGVLSLSGSVAGVKT